jgi:uncharacterized protein (DUF1499 family)
VSALGRLLSRFFVNEVRTGATPAYPAVQPLDLPLDPDAAFRAAIETARAMPRWTIVESSRAERSLRAEARTRLLRFTDDVRVRVEETPGGRSRVQVRSASRVGFTDFGTNARRIRDYLTRLEAIPR